MASMFVDDTSSNISYGGAWQATTAQEYVGRGPFGNPFRNTLHRLEGTQGSFTYNFTGMLYLASYSNMIHDILTVSIFRTSGEGHWDCSGTSQQWRSL